MNDATTLELGQSALQGRGADGDVHAAYGADVTVRNVPREDSNRRGWILQGEYLQEGSDRRTAPTPAEQTASTRRSSTGCRSSGGWARAANRRARASPTSWSTRRATAFPEPPNAGAVNVAWTPSEFSFIRLEYSHAKADAGVHPTDDRILLQMSYTIGYHPAHAY